jgi:hypothetical protein
VEPTELDTIGRRDLIALVIQAILMEPGIALNSILTEEEGRALSASYSGTLNTLL